MLLFLPFLQFVGNGSHTVYRDIFSCVFPASLHLLPPSLPPPPLPSLLPFLPVSPTYLREEGCPLSGGTLEKTSEASGLPNPFYILCVCVFHPFLSLCLVICMYVSVCGICGIRAHTLTHTQIQLHSALGLTSCLRLIS